MEMRAGERELYEGRPSWRALMSFYAIGIGVAGLVLVVVGVLAADRAPALAEQARSRDPRRLREAAERCEEVRQSLELNVTEDLALSALGFRLGALAGAR